MSPLPLVWLVLECRKVRLWSPLLTADHPRLRQGLLLSTALLRSFQQEMPKAEPET